MYDLNCLWTPKFTRFTRLQIYTWQRGDSSVSAPLSVCGHSRRKERFFSEIIFPNFSPDSTPLSFRLLTFKHWDDMDLCVRVCVC